MTAVENRLLESGFHQIRSCRSSNTSRRRFSGFNFCMAERYGETERTYLIYAVPALGAMAVVALVDIHPPLGAQPHGPLPDSTFLKANYDQAPNEKSEAIGRTSQRYLVSI